MPSARGTGRGRGILQSEYESAIDLLAQQQPNIFDMNDQSAPDTRTYKVLDKDAYMTGSCATCARRPVRGARSRRRRAADDQDQGRERLLRGLRHADLGHARAAGQRRLPPELHPSAFPVTRGRDAPPIGSGCGRPYPPEVTRFNCKVHIKAPDRYTLDSTPLVGPDPAYCAAIGYTDGRTICPVRPEGTADREACENWRVGHARDTGPPGSHLDQGGRQLLHGPGERLREPPSTQYSLFTYVPGTYIVTAENGAECTVSH
jgi:hypothetical protein